MNLDNYKAKPVTILKQKAKNGEERIELISDDHKAVIKCCEAYNTLATIHRTGSIFYTVTMMGYFK